MAALSDNLMNFVAISPQIITKIPNKSFGYFTMVSAEAASFDNALGLLMLLYTGM